MALAFHVVLVDGRVHDGGAVGQLREQPLLGAGPAPAPAAPARGHAAPSPGVRVVVMVVVVPMGRCIVKVKVNLHRIIIHKK